MLLQISCYAITVETTTNLNVYFPEYSKIDLVCGQMPKAAQKDVELCCEAAFTGELLNEFKHSNIADNHICNGVLKKGYRCKANTGGFVWGKGKWKFMRKTDYPTVANGWNMGFCQLLIFKDGTARTIGSAYKVTHALYLDMGSGWNYAWYRDNNGKVKEIFPESKLAPNYRYRHSATCRFMTQFGCKCTQDM